MTAHPGAIVGKVMAITYVDGGNRVYAVEWEEHDPLTCDGQHLELDTTGWLACPAPGCRWSFDPTAKCPKHGARGDA